MPALTTDKTEGMKVIFFLRGVIYKGQSEVIYKFAFVVGNEQFNLLSSINQHNLWVHPIFGELKMLFDRLFDLWIWPQDCLLIILHDCIDCIVKWTLICILKCFYVQLSSQTCLVSVPSLIH